MGWVILIAIPAMMFSLWLNDGKTPMQSDKEYLTQYRITHATKLSDEEILANRYEQIENSKKWKHTNKLLEEAYNKHNIEFSIYTLQYHADSIEFHSAYYDNNTTADEYIAKKYGVNYD